MTNTTTLVQLRPDSSYPPDGGIRRERGKAHMSATMIYWLARNGWSHPNLELLATWALNEPGVLHTSQVSHIRNAKMRMVGLKTLDSFGSINIAIWAYQNSRSAFDKLATGTVTAQIENLIKNAEVLINPATGEPLDQGGWMLLYLGYLRLDDVVGGAQGDEALAVASLGIGRLVSEQIARSGVGFVEARKLFGESFECEGGAYKLVAVAAGLDHYEPESLRRDIPEICSALRSIGGTWTPKSLVEELSN